MIISALSFSIMAAIVKATPHTVAVKAFSRQIFGCIFVLLIILINNNSFGGEGVGSAPKVIEQLRLPDPRW